MKHLSPSLYHSLQQYCLETEVISHSDRQLSMTARFEFGQNFSGFAGHFPGKPVLPAIAQLAAVRFIAELGLKQPLRPLSYRDTKFRHIIEPQEKITLQLQLRSQGDTWEGSFSLHKIGPGTVATGKCHFAKIRKT